MTSPLKFGLTGILGFFWELGRMFILGDEVGERGGPKRAQEVRKKHEWGRQHSKFNKSTMKKTAKSSIPKQTRECLIPKGHVPADCCLLLSSFTGWETENWRKEVMTPSTVRWGSFRRNPGRDCVRSILPLAAAAEEMRYTKCQIHMS